MHQLVLALASTGDLMRSPFVPLRPGLPRLLLGQASDVWI